MGEIGEIGEIGEMGTYAPPPLSMTRRLCGNSQCEKQLSASKRGLWRKQNAPLCFPPSVSKHWKNDRFVRRWNEADNNERMAQRVLIG